MGRSSSKAAAPTSCIAVCRATKRSSVLSCKHTKAAPTIACLSRSSSIMTSQSIRNHESGRSNVATTRDMVCRHRQARNPNLADCVELFPPCAVRRSQVGLADEQIILATWRATARCLPR